MRIGVPKEIKNQEFRVGLTPSSVRELVAHGHQVMVEANAGAAIGMQDEAYRKVGATITTTAVDIFNDCDMVIKVKEPQPDECEMLRKGQILYTYLHLAPNANLTSSLIKSGAVCIAYETITGPEGGLPLLAPMSEVAGRMAIQAAATNIESAKSGMGLLLGGVPGVPAAHIVIIGAGVVGTNSLQMAIGMGARVTILDKNLDRLRQLDFIFGNRVTTRYSSVGSVEEAVLDADVVIGSVLVPGAQAPKIVTREMVSCMKKGSVLVDVAIDQGGCFETSHPTTHSEPIFLVDGVVHYCVANMPGAVARTSTVALNNATLPYAIDLANKGWRNAMRNNQYLRNGLNICDGKVTHEAVSKALGQEHFAAEALIA